MGLLVAAAGGGFACLLKAASMARGGERRLGGLEEFSAVEEDGDGAVVDEGDFHVGSEAAGLGGDVVAFDFGDEAFVERVGEFWRGCVDEAGAFPFAGVSQECELADDEHAPSRIGDREVHFAIGVFEDAESDDLFGHGDDVGLGVVGGDAEEDEEAVGDGADEFAVDLYAGFEDALDDCSHGDAMTSGDARGRLGEKGVRSRSICSWSMACAMRWAVPGERRMPFRKWPLQTQRLSKLPARPSQGKPSGVAGRSPDHFSVGASRYSGKTSCAKSRRLLVPCSVTPCSNPTSSMVDPMTTVPSGRATMYCCFRSMMPESWNFGGFRRRIWPRMGVVGSWTLASFPMRSVQLPPAMRTRAEAYSP